MFSSYAYEAAEELSPIPLSPRGWIMGTARQMIRGASEESEPVADGGNMDGIEICENNGVRKYLPNGLKWLDQSATHLARCSMDPSDISAIADAQKGGINLGDVKISGFSQIEVGADGVQAAKQQVGELKRKLAELRSSQSSAQPGLGQGQGMGMTDDGMGSTMTMGRPMSAMECVGVAEAA